MPELKQTYFEDGKTKRIYKVDPKTGVEYCYYDDNKEGVTIRAALPEDARDICESMMPIMINLARRNRMPLDVVLDEETKKIRNVISRYNEQDDEISFVFERFSRKGKNKFIGYGETQTKKNDPTSAKVNMIFASPEAKGFYKERLCRAFHNMCEKYGLYDSLVLVNETGQEVEKQLYP